MKNIRLAMVIACTLLGTAVVNAQSLYDAARLMGNDLNGTARFIGMGGAMGALGGDISTMGTNPAGIGIYRSSDVMTSFGFSNIGMKSNMNGTKNEQDKLFGSFDNIGFVISSRIGNETPLRFVNFGFNYRKVKSFDKNMVMNGMIEDRKVQCLKVIYLLLCLKDFLKTIWVLMLLLLTEVPTLHRGWELWLSERE